jgi:hypothetical protein
MADQKLTDLTVLPSDLAAGDLIYVVRSGADYQANVNLFGGAALLDVGTTAGTVAAGNDSRIVAGGTALQPNGSAANLTSFPTLNQNTTGTAAGLSATLVPASGGTGVANNNASTLAISGNFATTLTVTGTTGVTLPTSGTLATTAQLTANPVTAAAVLADTALVVGSGGSRGVAASTLSGIPLLTSGVPSASNVTNHAQTQAAIVPNTAPAAGEILVGNAGGTAYAKAAVSGDAALASTGALTIAAGAVTLAKMANLAQDQFIGRTTASTGVPETATITAAARTVLDDATVSAMVDTLGGASATGTGGLVRSTGTAKNLTAGGSPFSYYFNFGLF